MSAIRIHHALAVVLAVLVASFATAAPAVAGDANPARVIVDPYFVATSGGAYVDYTLAAPPAKQRVLIDGAVAKVKLLDKGERLYRAIVFKAGLKHGRSYRVRITVRTKGQGTKLLDERLFLHKRNKVEPQS